jgi:hypothetical protein
MFHELDLKLPVLVLVPEVERNVSQLVLHAILQVLPEMIIGQALLQVQLFLLQVQK